jgi:hypothetical protein
MAAQKLRDKKNPCTSISEQNPQLNILKDSDSMELDESSNNNEKGQNP